LQIILRFCRKKLSLQPAIRWERMAALQRLVVEHLIRFPAAFRRQGRSG
jgi:hypothetical protein